MTIDLRSDANKPMVAMELHSISYGWKACQNPPDWVGYMAI